MASSTDTDDVQLTDLEVIQQFSLAVRGATAPRAQVIAALESDLAYLRKPAAKTAPAKTAPATRAPAKTAPATRAPATRAPAKTAPAKTAPAKRAPVKKAPAKKAVRRA
jgi:hypothetical protein